jgi:hypothetical protein
MGPGMYLYEKARKEPIPLGITPNRRLGIVSHFLESEWRESIGQSPLNKQAH